MTGYQVDTDYLYGYANQVEMNRAGGLATLVSYGGTHLTNFDRFNGLFEPAQWIPELFANQVNGRIFPALNDLLTYIAEQLAQTAITYDTADRNAKDKVVAAGVRQDREWEFDPWPAEEPPRQDPVTLGFTNGAAVDPKPPTDPHMTEWVEDKLNDLLGPVAELVEKFTGYDIVAEWTPVVLGDWGAGYRIADAWTEVAHSLRAIGADLDGGLNLLTAHWSAADSGGAAATFARFAHERTGAVPAFAELADAVSEAVKVPSLYYEGVIKNAFWVIEYYGVRFRAVAKKISKALKTCAQLIIQMGELAIEVIDLVAVTLEWKLGGR